MQRGVEHKFADADHFQESVRAANVELVLSERGEFDGGLTQIDFKELWMQRGHESLARVARIGVSPERAVIFFPDLVQSEFISNGVAVHPDQVVLYEPGQELHQRSIGGLHWGSFSLSPDYLARVARHAGMGLVIPSGGARLTPHPRSMRRLRHLHAAAAELLKNRPAIIVKPEPSHAMEQGLIETYLECLTQGESQHDRLSWRNRTMAIARLEELLEANQDRPLYMLEICEALGMQERTLQLCCRDFLGMSPTHYLRLRRMHLARRALRQEGHTATNVTEIATRFGFWELGRFAVHYRKLFGETPSMTLRRPPEDPNRMRIISRSLNSSETA
jgi:AraC-like DNA-binding protein